MKQDFCIPVCKITQKLNYFTMTIENFSVKSLYHFLAKLLNLKLHFLVIFNKQKFTFDQF